MDSDRPVWQQRLREAVRRSGMKQSVIAYDARVTPETLSRLLNTPNLRPTLATITSVAHAAGVSVGWLIGEDPYKLTAEEQGALREAVQVMRRLIG